MTNERMKELLAQIVEYVCIGENTNNSIEKLLNMGFETNELIDFGFCEVDIEGYLEEQCCEER